MSATLRPIKPLTSAGSRSRRSAPGAPMRVGVSLAAGTAKVHGWVRDVSVGGMFVETPSPLPENARVDLDGLIRDASRVIRFRAGGWVVRAQPTGMAIQFDSMDATTRAHLERLVAERPAQS